MTGFPSHVLKPGQRVLALFSAAFYGAQDVRFVHQAGVTNCVMVDHDSEKLSKMPYPFKRICSDCFEVIDGFSRAAVTFDVVICDQWSPLDKKINVEYIDKLKALAPIRILSACQPFLDTLTEPLIGDLYKRSTYLGGCYWRLL